MRSFNRSNASLRPVVITPNATMHAEGSCKIEFGHTHVLVTCSVEEKVPPHVMGTGSGWVTAEYGMLPRATHDRTSREAAKGKQTGRTMEIQRLIGRSLRAAVDLKSIGIRTFTLDCDVLQADGGTRTASITGAYVALMMAVNKLQASGKLTKPVKIEPVAAVSVGIQKGEVLVDLDYQEDSNAEVDMNLVSLAGGRLVEVQGTGEHGTFDRASLDSMLGLGLAAVEVLYAKQAEALK